MTQRATRPVGRPRARNKTTDGPARDVILLTAANLFGEKGFAGTSTRVIAEKVGIRQPSLFYHFKKKDDILGAIIDQIGDSWDSQVRNPAIGTGPATVSLYRLMWFDYLFLMTEPYRIGKLSLLPEIRTGRFRGKADRLRDRIKNEYRRLIIAGIDDGQIADCDVPVITNTIYGIGEAIWSWYQPDDKARPEHIAERLADFSMKGLLIRPSSLARVKRLAGV